MTYLNGEVYEGQFYNNMRQGFGKVLLPNNDFYEGYW